MEFRDKLISSEMRHLTELVSLLSCEVMILQDFIGVEFGLKYKRFRRRHAMASEDDRLGQGSKVKSGKFPKYEARMKPTSSASTPVIEKIDPPTKTDVISVVGNTDTEMLEDEGDEDNMLTGVDISDDDLESSDDEVQDDEMDENWTEEGRTGPGRTPDKIWEKFDCVKLPDGKKLSKCKKCGRKVSSVPKRLHKHYNNCERTNSRFSVKIPPPHGSSFSEASSTPGRKGRKPKGEVWKYFQQKHLGNGQVLVTCNFCSRKVSNHATRMARHLQNCSEAEASIGKDNSTTDTEADALT